MAVLGATIDLLHAALMSAWILGLPLLFVRRWPRVTAAYALYAVLFIFANQVSFMLLGECFLTTIARACWRRAGHSPSAEWFSVRLAEAVFGVTPSHLVVRRVSEALIFVTALAVLYRGIMERLGPHGHARRRSGPA
jgi:hypothetical protein